MVKPKEQPTVTQTLEAMSQNLQTVNMILEGHIQLFQKVTVSLNELNKRITKLELDNCSGDRNGK